MIQQAIASPDPVLYFGPKAKYWQKGEVDPTAPSAELHRTRIAREGTDCTVVGHGAMVTTLLQAAEVAHSEGTSLEIVDLRTLSPIDHAPLLASVRKTGRLVVAQAVGTASIGSEIAATVAEQAFLQACRPSCSASAARTCRSRPRSSRASTCPTPIACSRPSTAPCTTDPGRRRDP